MMGMITAIKIVVMIVTLIMALGLAAEQEKDNKLMILGGFTLSLAVLAWLASI